MRTTEEVAFLAGSNLPVTREEAHALVRHVTRTCRGKAVLPVEKMRAAHEKYDTFTALGDWSGAVSVCEGVEKEIGIQGPPVQREDWDALSRRALSAIYAHGDTVGKPCGADFNDQICAHPFDGQQRTGNCPNCGAEHVFTSPVFVIDEQGE